MTPWSMVANGSCRSARRKMSARIDGDLDDRARTRFDRHVAGCHRCALVLASLRRTLALLHDEREVLPAISPSVADHVLARAADDSVSERGSIDR